MLDIYESSRVKEEIFPWSFAFSKTWQTFKSPEISTEKLDPCISTVTVWTDGVGDGEGNPPAGGEGFGVGLTLGEGDADAAPKTAGDAEADGPGVADPAGVTEEEDLPDGLIEALTESFTEGFADGLGDGEGEGFGDTTTVFPKTWVWFVAGFNARKKKTAEPATIAKSKPERYNVGFDK